MTEPYGLVYGIKCHVNGKLYIGQTIRVQRLRDRIAEHFRSTKKHSAKLKNAIDKYGTHNFYYGVIDYCCTNQDDLNKLEESLIVKYDSVRSGYNIEHKVVSGGRRSEETKMKIRQVLAGKNFSGINNQFFGKKHNEQSRELMRVEAIRRNSSNEWKRKHSESRAKNLHRKYEEILHKIKTLRQYGTSYLAIAKSLGISEKTIHRARHHMGDL